MAKIDLDSLGIEELASLREHATDKLFENANSMIQAVIRAKPAAAKGKYVKKANIASTMGPGVLLDVTAAAA